MTAAIAQDKPEKQISSLCQQSKIGKKLPVALYVHISAINHLDRQLQEYENKLESCYHQNTLLL